ncbi:serine/threonine-protein kinase [Nonomuraea sp. NPDC059194]|uniref:serine/threonine-protein kinase n=1 Tax=Nonomuraea sp. NPDC059194 TaxID=3346764 RepID=UPI0036BB21C8
MASESDQLVAHRYRLARELGRGGMGVVWEGHDTLLNRSIAVKEVLLPPELSKSDRERHLMRTAREARTAAKLNHPSVVAVYDVVEEGGRPWIIMELVRAPSLDDVVATHGALPIKEAADVGRQVLAALKAAHDVGILHRDVKPSNILLCDDGRAVLTDFGIATAEGDSSLTRTGMVTGSPAFLAPERVRALDDIGPPSDLWSLGATLYAALTGRSPFERGEPMATLSALLGEEPDYRRIPPALHPVLKGLLKKEPEERLSAAEADALLAEIIDRQAARRDDDYDDRPPARRRASRTTLMAAAVAVLVVTVGAGAYLKLSPEAAQGSARLPQAQAASPLASAPATSAPPATASPTPTVSRKPITRLWSSPAGWSIQRPTRWRGARAEAYTQWTRPDRSAHLGVEQQYATLDPHQILRDAEEAMTAATDVRTVRRKSAALGAVDWEFTWTAAAGHPWATEGRLYHEVRRAVVSGDTAYVVSWTVAEEQWRRHGRMMRQVMGSFTPGA